MSRKIKVRLYSKPAKKYIDYITVGFLNTGELRSYSTENGFGPVLEDNYIVEQYTGIKDKNGKEIYEGDIVKMPDWQVKPKYEKVRFAKLSCGFEPFVCGCFECIAPDGEEVEVIGNIHENPELLEDK